MNMSDLLQGVLYIVPLLALAWPLGLYMAAVYEGRRPGLARWLAPLETLLYRLTGVDPGTPMNWKRYATDFLIFNAVGTLAVYALQRLQGFLPLNPAGLSAVTPDSSFNTAISFATNTNWQGYAGETTMSHLTQMLALTVQNFVSAAGGMAVAVAVIRGLKRRETHDLGNFWADLVRGTVHILLPLSFVLALVLVSQGVVQTMSGPVQVPLLEAPADPAAPATQTLALGPAASQVAIKQLGTNGGGFFNANGAHPFENPTPFSNLLQVLAINLIGAAFCATFGAMVGDRRQGLALLAAMTILFTPLMVGAIAAEAQGNPALAGMSVDMTAGPDRPGGNMEGKEVRHGVAQSAIWAAATTAASNGSVNAMHDSFTPLGGLVPMFLMQLGEVVYGGVGSGLYGMLLFVVIAVFAAGLMVGRTPEYLGKKIEAREMKMASIGILIPCAAVLIGTALSVVSVAGLATIFNPGPHGFSEALYAFSSAGNNNGSAFAGLGANTPFYNLTLGVAMFLARYGVAVPALALAGALAAKKTVPAGPGTLPTDTPVFVLFLCMIVLIVGGLTFFPALALGPVVEHLMLPIRP